MKRLQVNGIAASVALVAALGWVPPSNGATRRVPSEYATINNALDASAAGDTVLVAPGMYTVPETRYWDGFWETSLAFLRDGIVLRSEAGSAATTLDMQGQGQPIGLVVVGIGLRPLGCSLEGFTVTGGPDGGVRLKFSVLRVKDCLFRDLDVGVYSGGGIHGFLSDVTLDGCRFENCRAGTGGAVSVERGSLIVDDTDVERCGNVALFVSTGQLGHHVAIRDSRFVENQTAIGTSVVFEQVLIERCRFEGNYGIDEWGAVILGNSKFRVHDCLFLNNWVTGSAGGADIYAGGDLVQVIENNTFYGTSIDVGSVVGASLFLQPLYQYIVRNNVFAGVRGGPAIEDAHSGTVIPSCNVFWDNPEGNAVGFTLSATDRQVDPLFCDPPNSDFRVMVGSPCLPDGSIGCGLIGAFGEGCGTVSVDATSWGRLKASFRGVKP